MEPTLLISPPVTPELFYPVLSSVTLTCIVSVSPTTPVTYQWNTTGCYTNINYNDGVPSCFPHDQTTQNVTDNDLTAEDAGTFSCTVHIHDSYFTSRQIRLHVSGRIFFLSGNF